MQIPSVNVASPMTQEAGQQEPVSLSQRIGATGGQPSSTISNGDSVTSDSIIQWLFDNQQEVLSNPDAMGKKLCSQIDMMVDANGKRLVNSNSTKMEYMDYFRNIVTHKDGYENMDDFFVGQYSKLLGVEIFMQGFIAQMTNPTPENGAGMPIDYD